MNIKNNRHGWGLAEMLILSAVILIFLGIAIYFIFRLYSALGKDPGVVDPILDGPSGVSSYSTYTSYADMEKKLEDAAKKYAQNHYANGIGSDTLMVNVRNLENEGLADKVLDVTDGNICEGYVTIQMRNDNLLTKAYIACSHYKSSGYQD